MNNLIFIRRQRPIFYLLFEYGKLFHIMWELQHNRSISLQGPGCERKKRLNKLFNEMLIISINLNCKGKQADIRKLKWMKVILSGSCRVDKTEALTSTIKQNLTQRRNDRYERARACTSTGRGVATFYAARFLNKSESNDIIA